MMLRCNLYKKWLLLLSPSAYSQVATTAAAQTGSPPGDTLTAQVAHWRNPKPAKKKAHVDHHQPALSSELLKGSTRDLSLLDITSFTLDPGGSSPAAMDEADADALVIVKLGSLTVITPDTPKVLGPGGVALFAAGDRLRLTNTSTSPAICYLFLFQSRSPGNPGRARQAGPPLLIDWHEMVMKRTDKGESRSIFNRPLSSLGRIDMHATTLNPGTVSHPPHVHRTEEIILLRSGNVREYIAGQYHTAAAGDLIFLPSGVPHAVENAGKTSCEYFALQWQQ